MSLLGDMTILGYYFDDGCFEVQRWNGTQAWHSVQQENNTKFGFVREH